MKILGIDHGQRTGFSLIENAEVVHTGYFTLEDLRGAERFSAYRDKVKDIILKYKPDVICVEKPVSFVNANSARALCGLYAITMMVAFDHDIDVIECNLSKVRRAITGRGNAEKIDVCNALEKRYGVDRKLLEIPCYYKKKTLTGVVRNYFYDESDATALAYWYYLSDIYDKCEFSVGKNNKLHGYSLKDIKINV